MIDLTGTGLIGVTGATGKITTSEQAPPTTGIGREGEIKETVETVVETPGSLRQADLKGETLLRAAVTTRGEIRRAVTLGQDLLCITLKSITGNYFWSGSSQHDDSHLSLSQAEHDQQVPLTSWSGPGR